MTGLDVLPLGARRQRRQGHRPPRDHPDQRRAHARQDERGRPQDLRPGRAPLPGRRSTPRRCSRTRASRRPSPSTSSARAARCCSCPAGAASTASCRGRAARADDEDEGRDQRLPKLEQGEDVDDREVESLEKETKPPRRYTDASLLGAMETAGKLVDDDELREAMKESGIGTPATRAAIIERLIDVGYIERDGRALVATEKGLNVIRLLGEHPLTSPTLTGDWENRLAQDRARRRRAQGVHGATSPSSPGRRSASSTPSSRTSASRAPTSARARSAATTSSRTARATRAGRARTRAAAS